MAEEPEKKIEVSESVLKEIIAKNESLEGKVDKLTKDNEKLLAVADKGRLANYDSQHGDGNLIRTATISVWEGKRVIGWGRGKNEVDFVNGVIRENQTTILYLLDPKDPKKPIKQEIDILSFARRALRETGEIIRQAEDSNHQKTYTLRFKDGMEIDMDIAFINQ